MANRTSNYRLPLYNEGDKVWLDNCNLPLLTKSRKLSPKREGLFEILKKITPVTFKLKLPKTWKIHNTFHANLLSSVMENHLYGKHFTKPPPDLIDDEESYEVKAILNHCRIRNKFQYLIKWQGYPTSKNTWEPEQHLTNANQVLNSYKKQYKIP